jgi:DNA-binding protein HU-beta
VIEEALEAGDKVTLVGFGTFSTYRRPARRGRNPKTGSAIKIDSKHVVKFKSGTRLNREVR